MLCFMLYFSSIDDNASVVSLTAVEDNVGTLVALV